MKDFKQFFTENVDQRFHFLKKGDHFRFKGDPHTWMKVDEKRGMNKSDIRGPQIYSVAKHAKVEKIQEEVVAEGIFRKIKNAIQNPTCKRCNGYGNILGRAEKYGTRDVHTTCPNCNGSGFKHNEPTPKYNTFGCKIHTEELTESSVIAARLLKAVGLGRHERFRKSVKILPGVKLNFSKTGHTVTVGPPHAKISWGKSGVRKSIGIPHSGIYWRWDKSNKKKKGK